MITAKEIVINASMEEVKEIVNDFHSWPKWSPWLISEPDAQVNINAEGNFYSWDGQIIGAGEMRMEKMDQYRSDIGLKFLRPFKVRNKEFFDFTVRGAQTVVKWSMDFKLPFFLFWMKNKTAAYIGSDLQRGLKMLKSYIETGSVPSKVEYLGVQNFEGTDYASIQRENVTMSAVSEDMGPDFEKLMTQLKTGNGLWFTIYDKFDFVNDQVSYKACVGVDDLESLEVEKFQIGELPQCQVYVTRHVGPYEFVGNAWSSAMMQMRAKAFKQNKKFSPFEIYRNSPQNTPADELITDICFVVKG